MNTTLTLTTYKMDVVSVLTYLHFQQTLASIWNLCSTGSHPAFTLFMPGLVFTNSWKKYCFLSSRCSTFFTKLSFCSLVLVSCCVWKWQWWHPLNWTKTVKISHKSKTMILKTLTFIDLSATPEWIMISVDLSLQMSPESGMEEKAPAALTFIGWKLEFSSTTTFITHLCYFVLYTFWCFFVCLFAFKPKLICMFFSTEHKIINHKVGLVR